VYVFTQSADVWSQQAYVKASNAGFSDSFGTSVSLSEDTLAVGAPGEASAATGVNGDQNSDAAPYSGAVYVFTRSAGVWSQQAYVKASNAGFNDRFAASVSLSEDTLASNTGDEGQFGTSVSGNTLAAGAWGEDSAAMGVNGDQSSRAARYSGAVYVRRIAP